MPRRLFYPDNQELSVFRLTGEKYTSVTQNEAGRLPVAVLDTLMTDAEARRRVAYETLRFAEALR